MIDTIADKLTTDIFESSYFQKLYQKISLNYGRHEVCKIPTSQLLLPDKEFFDLYRFADILSCSENSYARNTAFRIVSHLFPLYKNDYHFQKIANAVLLKLGNFPSIELLHKNEDVCIELPFSRIIERSFKEDTQQVPHRENEYFTDAQFRLFGKLSKSKCFSFSGPTSVGKSYIIRAFLWKVLENVPPENIVVSVPTRALINQFSIDIKGDLKEVIEKYHYRISTNSNIVEYVEDTESRYIFILTPERLLSYLSRPNNPPLGYLFVDEAHKLATENDYRSIVTYNAIERTLRRHPDINLYFSSPNVANPEVFLKAFKTCSNNLNTGNIDFTEESPVAQNRFFVDLSTKNIWQYIDDNPVLLESDSLEKVNDCTDLILSVGQSKHNIVYCNTKSSTLDYAGYAFDKMPAGINELPKEITKAIRQIKTYIHEDFYLAKFLAKGVAYHYGNLPQIIRNIVEDLYRRGKIKYLFCTSTLLEGVNLPAQNVFIIKKGYARKELLRPIDFKNLAGRAGRLGIELAGNVVCVKHQDNEWDKSEVCTDKERVVLELSVDSRIKHNLNKIEKILKNKDISGTGVEKQILRYIANIICLDTMSLKADYKSPIIMQLIESNKEKIIEYAKQKTDKIETPIALLETTESIDLDIQENLYKQLKAKPEKLHAKVNYKNALFWLEKLFDIYKWEQTEPDLKHKKSLIFYK